MKKFTEELTKLTTPDIRSVLRWLNNEVERHVKPTELASMKHDKCLKIIEDKYKPADIEKALDNISSGNGKTHARKTKPEGTVTVQKETPNSPKQAKPERKLMEVLKELHDTADKFDGVLNELKRIAGKGGDEGASYVVEIKAGDASVFYVIAASGNGACVLEGPHPSAEAAHKSWPEAILPAPLAKAEDLKDML
jgi:hypothetical protein